jgi:hypothetical protein
MLIDKFLRSLSEEPNLKKMSKTINLFKFSIKTDNEDG